MDAILRHRSPLKTCVSTRTTEQIAPKTYASSLTSKDKFPVRFNLYELLLVASEKEQVSLQIPETLIMHPATSEPVFMYTDKDGVVRVLTGPTSKIRQRKNLNPMGHRFPKFISFTNNTALCTLNKCAELKGYMLGDWERIQRYVVSEGFTVQKKVIRWRKTKRSKVYSTVSRMMMSTRRSTESLHTAASSSASSIASAKCPYSFDVLGEFLDYNFVASLHNPRSCEVSKDPRSCPEAELIAPTLRHLIETYGPVVPDDLNEFVFSLLKSQDGRWYFLNCARGSLIDSGVGVKRHPTHRKTQSINELSAKLIEMGSNKRMPSMCLPKLNLKDAVEQKRMMMLQPPAASPPKMRSNPHTPTHTDRIISSYIGNIAGKMDELREQAHMLKQVNGSKQIMKFKHYAPGFLENVIKKVYDFVMKDPKLTRYYRHKDQIRGQVESAVRHAIVNGITKSRLREIHQHLYITDSAYDRYVCNFIAALRSEFVRPDEITAAEAYFEGFREDIVTVKWEEIEEP